MIAAAPKSFSEVESELSAHSSVYERQEYLRRLASTQTGEVIDTLIDELIDEGTKDVSKANWAHSIALFLASVVRDVDRLQNIVTVTWSTRVRIKAAETLIRDLYAKGDKERLSKVTKDLIFTQAPRLKKCIINTILDDDMQDLADALIDAVLASYGPHLATQLLPACSETTVCRLLPVIVPHPGPTSRKLILRYPQAMFDFITTSNTGEALAVEYHAEIEYFIRHRINTEPKALSLVMAYMDAMVSAGKGTTAYWLVDRGIMPILSLLMEFGHSKEVIKWLKEKNGGRQLSYKDDPWNLSFNAARDWPVEALVRDLGREETFELLSEVVSMEYMHTLTRRVSNNELRYDLIAYMWHKAVVADIPLGRIPTLDVCIALKGQLDLLGEVAIDCYKYYSDSKQFPNEDQRLAYVEYMPGREADPVLADRLKSSDTSKRVRAYKNRLQQALHYDKKEHRLPQVLQKTVKEIANEQNPVRGDVMTALRSLPIPPLCEPKSKDPHAVVEAVDALVTSLNRSKEQIKGSPIAREGQALISNIIRSAPLDSELYKTWEDKMMEAFDRLITNDRSNSSVIDDGFLMNITGIRKQTVERILHHLSGFLRDIHQQKDRLTKDLIQDLRVVFRLVGSCGGKGSDGLRLPVIRPIVEDIVENPEKYTFRPRHPMGVIDMLIEIQSDLVQALEVRPWTKEKEQWLWKIVTGRPKLLTDNDQIFRLARRRLPSMFTKFANGDPATGGEKCEKLQPPRCCRGFSGGVYRKEDLDMSWWTDAEVEVIHRMVEEEFSNGNNSKRLSYGTKHHKLQSLLRTTKPAYFVKSIQGSLHTVAAGDKKDDQQQQEEDDALALMEVDMKLLSSMDTVDAESAKVFLTPELLTSDAARTAPFCLSRVASTTLTEDQFFNDFIGSTFRSASQTGIKLTVHKELCRAAATFGSIDRRQYWLKYRLFTRDGTRKHVHKDIVQAIGSAFIHNMLWCPDWQVLEVCIDMTKEVPDALKKYIASRPGILQDFCDTTDARCRYIQTVLLPVLENGLGDQDLADSCITALQTWSQGKPGLAESADSVVVSTLKHVLTDKDSSYSLFYRVTDLYSSFVSEGSEAALSAYVEAFDFLLDTYWKPSVKGAKPMNPDDTEAQKVQAITRNLLQATRTPSKVKNLKSTLCHIADALEGVVGLGSLWNDAKMQYILADKSANDLGELMPAIKEHFDAVEGSREDLVWQCITIIAKWLGPEFPRTQVLSLASSSDYRFRLLAVQLYDTRNSDERPDAISTLWEALCKDPKLAVREEAFRAVTHLRMLL
ncbi:hypothetical protein FOZ62_013076 [Perkinsus olseni]|uniref:Uncharacterized protein n=2 Tax=Perkinsus olseni TaxID=32597 RepID=A0A7J6T3V7_PEROL|nr:hypothetical protein FOZ62_013076 [Perkinsus olseni]